MGHGILLSASENMDFMNLHITILKILLNGLGQETVLPPVLFTVLRNLKILLTVSERLLTLQPLQVVLSIQFLVILILQQRMKLKFL